MADVEGAGADGAQGETKRVGIQWLVAIAAVVTAVSGLVGAVVAGTRESGSAEPSSRISEAGSSASGDAPGAASAMGVPVPTIETARRPPDGRWVVVGTLPDVDDGADRTYDVYVIAEASTGIRLVSERADFVDARQWRATFADAIDVTAEVTFIPGVHVRVPGAFGGPGPALQPASVDDPGSRPTFRERLEHGLVDLDAVGEEFEAS